MDERVWKIIESWNYWDRWPDTGIWREVTDKALRFGGGTEAIYFFGPRRGGKTTTCLQVISKLSEKYGSKSCIYLNFEEPVFSGLLTTELIEWAVKKHAQMHRVEPKFVFLDEVQHVLGWEKWVRSAVDKKKYSVFVTGSSAKLLSSEFATSLGGRGLGFLVLPFSFREYKKVNPKASLEDFLKEGGYPAVVLEKNREKATRLLEEYFDSAISRDISARYSVRDVPTLRTLAVYMLTNPGKPVSYNKLRAMTGLSFDAIKLYLSYLEDAFLIFQVPHFSYSMKKALQKPRKYYAYDLGLQTAVSKSYSPDVGRKAENIVAIELKRRGKDVQYYSNDGEVDFIVKEGLKLTAINVCYSEKPRSQENKGLQNFTKKHKTEKCLLLAGENKIENWLMQEENQYNVP